MAPALRARRRQDGAKGLRLPSMVSKFIVVNSKHTCVLMQVFSQAFEPVRCKLERNHKKLEQPQKLISLRIHAQGTQEFRDS